MKVYLGDAVYAEDLDCEILLTTEDGINITNKIYLEGAVILALIDFLKSKKWIK